MYTKKLLAASLLVLTLASGCWNKRELNEMAIVMGVGVDKGKHQDFRISAQIVKPGEMRSQGGGGQGGASAEPIVVLTSEGNTVFTAVRNFLTHTSRKLFFSHNQLFVFGEDLAKSGLGEVIDFFERDHELRQEVPLTVARGKAEDILNLKGTMEKASAVEINDTLEAARFSGKTPDVDLNKFAFKYNSKTASAFAPMIEKMLEGGKETFRFSGTAVFKNGKLVGHLDEKETRGMLWILSEIKGGIIPVTLPGTPKREVSIEITGAKSRLRTDMAGDTPVISVEIEQKGNVGEIEGMVDVTDPEVVRAIERETQDTIRQEIQAALSKCQKVLKADVFGFGEELHRAYPAEWRKLKNHWDEVFPRVQVRQAIKSRLLYSGDKTVPTRPK